tara:strand:+ start:606 stop:839 length:234 start_codon:yes stop_codon:yes gene_type:complete
MREYIRLYRLEAGAIICLLLNKRNELHSNTSSRGLPNGNNQSCAEAKGRGKGKASAGKLLYAIYKLKFVLLKVVFLL